MSDDIQTPNPGAEYARAAIRRRRSGLRDQRVSRLAGVAIFGTVLLCFFMTWQRDAAEREQQKELMQEVRVFLAERLRLSGELPPSITRNASGYPRKLPSRYLNDAGRTYFDELPDPVIVATSQVIKQYLRPNGCSLLVRRDGRLGVEWWNSGPTGRAWEAQARKIAELAKADQDRPVRLP